MSQANVRSIEAIKGFKLALLNYSEEARLALDAMETEIRQIRNWLERDQYSYWQGQVKRAKESIAEARSDLHRRQLSQMNSDAVSDSDQKEALRIAKRRLEEAEDKVERIRKWVPVLEHALSEYHSQSQPLSDRLSGGLVGSLAMLERMIVALEGYMAIQAPAAPVLPPLSSSGEVSSTHPNSESPPISVKSGENTEKTGSDSQSDTEKLIGDGTISANLLIPRSEAAVKPRTGLTIALI